ESAHGKAVVLKPVIGAVRPPEALHDFVRAARRDRSCEHLNDMRKVVGVNRVVRPPLSKLLEGPTRVFDELAIDELEVTVLVQKRDWAWNTVHDEPRLAFTFTNRLLRPLALDPLRDRAGHRCERVENGFRKWATREQRHHSDQPILDDQRVSGEGNHSVRLCPSLILNVWIVHNVVA